MTDTHLIHVPVSVGELIDKITILDIKAVRIPDPVKLANIERERAALHAIRSDLPRLYQIIPDETQLRAVNEQLWEVEDALRTREANGDFGADFVADARSVYRLNDKRAALKYSINQITGSALVEEKSYDHPM